MTNASKYLYNIYVKIKTIRKPTNYYSTERFFILPEFIAIYIYIYIIVYIYVYNDKCNI